MKKLTGIIVLLSILVASQAMAFDEDKFTRTLMYFNKVAVPVSAMKGKVDDSMATPKGNAKGGNSSGQFPHITAEKINKQLEVLIRGIESAKGVATALAVIINLYESNKISVEVALTAVQILKLRAVFLKVFISNGNSELEIMIKVLEDNESELSKHLQAKRQAEVQVKGRINAAGAY